MEDLEKDLLSFAVDPEKDLVSFAVPVAPFVDPFEDGNELPEVEPPANGIWDDLRAVIEDRVIKDGIRKAAILPYETEAEVVQDAVTQIYSSVSEFYAWYFNQDDDRTAFLIRQKQAAIPPAIRAAVKPVVDDNLDAMREADEIPTGQDTDRLDEAVTDNLSRYITNWQDWYYDRKEEDAIDSYFEQASVYEDSYLDSDYGDLSNLLDDGQFDYVSDVPYIGEPSS